MGWVVRHGLRSPNRLTTNGGPRTTGWGPRTGSEAWVLLAVWFDATVRRLPGGSPRTGWGPTVLRSDRLGESAGGCVVRHGRPKYGARAAHHERGGADDWLGGLGAVACVVRHDRPKTPGRLTTNGVGADDWLGRLGAAGCVVRHDRPKTPGAAHHERGGADDWLGGLGAVACVVRHDSFDRLRTGSSKTAGRLTTNGVGPASLGGYRNVRPGVSRPGCRARPVGGGRLPRKRWRTAVRGSAAGIHWMRSGRPWDQEKWTLGWQKWTHSGPGLTHSVPEWTHSGAD